MKTNPTNLYAAALASIATESRKRLASLIQDEQNARAAYDAAVRRIVLESAEPDSPLYPLAVLVSTTLRTQRPDGCPEIILTEQSVAALKAAQAAGLLDASSPTLGTITFYKDFSGSSNTSGPCAAWDLAHVAWLAREKYQRANA